MQLSRIAKERAKGSPESVKNFLLLLRTPPGQAVLFFVFASGIFVLVGLQAARPLDKPWLALGIVGFCAASPVALIGTRALWRMAQQPPVEQQSGER